jgi:hypothetical protein
MPRCRATKCHLVQGLKASTTAGVGCWSYYYREAPATSAVASPVSVLTRGARRENKKEGRAVGVDIILHAQAGYHRFTPAANYVVVIYDTCVGSIHRFRSTRAYAQLLRLRPLVENANLVVSLVK